MPKSSCKMMCFLGTYALGMTIAFLVAVVVCVVTTGTCQEIHNGRNATNFQEAQTRQTNIMVDFFSDVEAKGSEISKQEAGCPEKEQKLPKSKLLRAGCFRASNDTLHLSLSHFGSLSETILLQDEAETTGGGN